MGSTGNITHLISAWQSGDTGAESALFEALYTQLRKIAQRCLRTERPGGSLGPTMLVHEAYLRFERAEKLQIVDRNHFLALVARVMKRIIVDQARARHSRKRDHGERQDMAGAALLASDSDADEILAVDQALQQLAKHSERQARMVELRYFGGFTEDESASILGISTRTLRREWQVARTRLKVAIAGIEPLG